MKRTVITLAALIALAGCHQIPFEYIEPEGDATQVAPSRPNIGINTGCNSTGSSLCDWWNGASDWMQGGGGSSSSGETSDSPDTSSTEGATQSNASGNNGRGGNYSTTGHGNNGKGKQSRD